MRGLKIEDWVLFEASPDSVQWVGEVIDTGPEHVTVRCHPALQTRPPVMIRKFTPETFRAFFVRLNVREFGVPQVRFRGQMACA